MPRWRQHAYAVYAYAPVPQILPTIDHPPTHRLPTGLQPDCLHGLRTTLRYVLVHPTSVIFLLVDACVGLNWLLVSFLSHVNKNIIHSFMRRWDGSLETTISWSGPGDYRSWRLPNHSPGSATATVPGEAHAAEVHTAAVCQEMHLPAVRNLCTLHVKETVLCNIYRSQL